MKKLFIIAVLIITANLSAQTLIQDSHYIKNGIDVRENYKPILVDMRLKGFVEIDGHLFNNNTSKDPVNFKADLDGIKIYDSKKEYQKRKCNIENCKTIHLEPKTYSDMLLPNYYRTNTLELVK